MKLAKYQFDFFDGGLVKFAKGNHYAVTDEVQRHIDGGFADLVDVEIDSAKASKLAQKAQDAAEKANASVAQANAALEAAQAAKALADAADVVIQPNPDDQSKDVPADAAAAQSIADGKAE